MTTLVSSAATTACSASTKRATEAAEVCTSPSPCVYPDAATDTITTKTHHPRSSPDIAWQSTQLLCHTPEKKLR
ncbi:hypothetical protein E2C01_066909 [Portunus trituberculatus]|uniref:Uncharacterized protein n=1 Tax=Portunus trituberculatus TaxID=210409 RepID=A0A5B7HTM0_PORTR|nr:hypothetical protein [Portunus trituberculatus]